MKAIFDLILFQPIFNAFVAIYNTIPDVGVVIIILTVIIKAILYPLTSSSIKAQKSLQELQPKLDELKKKYKDKGKEGQQELAQETMKLYRENKVNPLGSCLPVLVQLPIFLALYWVLQDGLQSKSFELLYSFVKNPGHINPLSFGFVDLSKGGGIESFILALLAGAAQFFQTKMLTQKRAPKVAGAGAKDENMLAIMNTQMLYMMPLLTVFVGWRFPSGLAFYWFLSTLLTGLQQMMMFRKKDEGSKQAEIH